jgi:hypothetical protein
VPVTGPARHELFPLSPWERVGEGQVEAWSTLAGPIPPDAGANTAVESPEPVLNSAPIAPWGAALGSSLSRGLLDGPSQGKAFNPP